MIVTTVLVIVSCLALAAVLVEVARRAVAGRAVEQELREVGVRPTPIRSGRDRSTEQAWGRQAA